jgi:hypothetical protein
MFVGHYGVSFAAKPLATCVPLWVWFTAVQWLDVVWSVLVLLGVEKLHIVPGFTQANSYDLYYMPYTPRAAGIDRAVADPRRRGGLVHAWQTRRDSDAGRRGGILALGSRPDRARPRPAALRQHGESRVSACGDTSS